MARPQTTPPVAVVGAGFSGTMVALHLRRALPPDRPILLCDRAGTFARGLAYGTANPDHLLNLRASNMSALPEQPDHFVQWLAGCGADGSERVRHTSAGSFAARGLYGDYLGKLLGAAIVETEQVRPPLSLRSGTIVDLLPSGDGYRMHLAAGDTITVAGAVLACGNLSKGLYRGSRFGMDPWDTVRLDGLDPDRPLLVVGSGLTMIDAVAALRRRGFPGPILAVSRHGLLPHSHAPGSTWPTPDLTPEEAASTRHLLRRVRAEIMTAAEAGIGWRGVIDGLRPISVTIWRGLPHDERVRFLRHLRAFWDVHRHRAAPPAADMIAQEQASGRLRVLGAKIEAVNDDAEGVSVRLRRRGSSQARTLHVQHIVDASGVGRVIDTDEPLLRRLLDAGRVRPDALGLGLDVSDDFTVLDRNGRGDAPLWTLGPLLRGTQWECTAVPDIRLQAVAVAQRVAARLRTP